VVLPSGYLSARQGALGSLAQSVDHIGSTAVPGLVAKDCIDIQVRVEDLDGTPIVSAFDAIGFRLRPEPWSRVEITAGKRWPKLVFAAPTGEPASNVHVRETASATTRRNLLFRDFLRADDPARDAWGDFKQRLAQSATNIYDYGQIKSPATEILMIAAEDWARRTAWTSTLCPHGQIDPERFISGDSSASSQCGPRRQLANQGGPASGLSEHV
jgi:GrpB-like predicted nucleotidyltransferase (UPF0157 family)